MTEKESKQYGKLVRALTTLVLFHTKAPGRYLTLEPDIVKTADERLASNYKLRIRRGEDDSLVLSVESPNPNPDDEIAVGLKNN